MNRLRVGLAALILTSVAGAFAQDATEVRLYVSVRDIYKRDGYLPDAKVVVTNNMTGTKVEAVTGADGRASLWVRPGSHRIAISAAGYGSLVATNFCVVAGQPAPFDAVLGPQRPGSPLEAIPPPVDVPRPRSVPTVPVMTLEQVREAMAFGRRSTKLSGYELTARQGLARRDVGRLFTPFLRVATMTQLADAIGKPFGEGEIPRALVEQIAWIVAPAGIHSENSSGDETLVETLRYHVPPTEVMVQPRDAKGRLTLRPIWKGHLFTPCDAEIFEALLGRHFPLPSIVAAFPMDAIQPGAVIAVTYSTTADPPDRRPSLKIKAKTLPVTISEDDLRRWK